MRRHRATATLFALTLTAATFAAQPAGGSASEEADLLRMLNQRRTDNGRKALQARSDLISIARRHSSRMAERGEIYHNPRLSSEIKGERGSGENVGAGPDASSLDQAFWDSSGHRSNILHRGFNEVGVGAVRTPYELYVTVVFADRPPPEPARAPAEKRKEPEGSRPRPASVASSASAGRGTPAGGGEATATRAPSPPEMPSRSVVLLGRALRFGTMWDATRSY